MEPLQCTNTSLGICAPRQSFSACSALTRSALSAVAAAHLHAYRAHPVSPTSAAMQSMFARSSSSLHEVMALRTSSIASAIFAASSSWVVCSVVPGSGTPFGSCASSLRNATTMGSASRAFTPSAFLQTAETSLFCMAHSSSADSTASSGSMSKVSMDSWTMASKSSCEILERRAGGGVVAGASVSASRTAMGGLLRSQHTQTHKGKGKCCSEAK